MKPSPIPEAEMFPGHQRVVFSKPEGEEFEEVLPVEVQAAVDDEMGLPMMRVRIELEPGDVERLAAGEPFWLTFWGHMPIFDVAMTEVLPDLTEAEARVYPIQPDEVRTFTQPRRIADWEDTSAEPNGIGPVCRHCHRLIDLDERDHAPDCWVVTHAT